MGAGLVRDTRGSYESVVRALDAASKEDALTLTRFVPVAAGILW